VQTNFYCIEKTSKHFVLSICLFLCHFFRRTVNCFAYFILNSESFRMEQVYIDSARSPLREYIIKLNQPCLVRIDDSKYKAGRHLCPHCIFFGMIGALLSTSFSNRSSKTCRNIEIVKVIVLKLFSHRMLRWAWTQFRIRYHRSTFIYGVLGTIANKKINRNETLLVDIW
jgi:hypothetical protein